MKNTMLSARHRGMRAFRVAGIASLLILIVGSHAQAAENGADHYPTGTNTVEPALMPPVGGSLWLNYLTFYTADSFTHRIASSRGMRAAGILLLVRLFLLQRHHD